MGLRINQNIGAMNAARNLRNTDNQMSRSLERLSSGFRINRAADDPAGLIISENLRAQIAGLGQAIRNSESAVNLIKTAEAALDEVIKQLRSIRTLALDALNTGASDSGARAADQTQIASSIESITRIGNTTQFGKITLLNGSAGVAGTTDDANLTFISGTTKTKSGDFAVAITTAATRGVKTFNTLLNEFQKDDMGTRTINDGVIAKFNIDFGINTSNTLSPAQSAALAGDLTAAGLVSDTSQLGVTVVFDTATAVASVTIDPTISGVSANTSTKAVALLNANTSLSSVMNFSVGSTAAQVRMSTKYAGLGFRAIDTGATNGKLFNNATVNAAAVSDLGTSIGSAVAPTAQGANAIKLFRETLTFNGNDKVTIASGTLVVNLASTINNALEGTETKLVAKIQIDNGVSPTTDLIFTNTEFGSGVQTVNSNKNFTATKEVSHTGIGATSQEIKGLDVAGTIATISGTGAGQILTLNSP
ncbi:MAG: flagellin, partial [Nitrospinota bacterium]